MLDVMGVGSVLTLSEEISCFEEAFIEIILRSEEDVEDRTVSCMFGSSIPREYEGSMFKFCSGEVLGIE